MSRSAPAPPIYLFNAIRRVERLLADVHPQALTAREIAQRLQAEGFRWPLRDGYVRKTDKDGNRVLTYRDNAYAEPTTERVRRVCEIKGNGTRIGYAYPVTRPHRYTIPDWALETVRKGDA